jgi:hypothetical protein
MNIQTDQLSLEDVWKYGEYQTYSLKLYIDGTESNEKFSFRDHRSSMK